jgi:hypothetical protein
MITKHRIELFRAFDIYPDCSSKRAGWQTGLFTGTTERFVQYEPTSEPYVLSFLLVYRVQENTVGKLMAAR